MASIRAKLDKLERQAPRLPEQDQPYHFPPAHIRAARKYIERQADDPYGTTSPEHRAWARWFVELFGRVDDDEAAPDDGEQP